jgi:hypothetical protein
MAKILDDLEYMILMIADRSFIHFESEMKMIRFEKFNLFSLHILYLEEEYLLSLCRNMNFTEKYLRLRDQEDFENSYGGSEKSLRKTELI